MKENFNEVFDFHQTKYLDVISKLTDTQTYGLRWKERIKQE